MIKAASLLKERGHDILFASNKKSVFSRKIAEIGFDTIPANTSSGYSFRSIFSYFLKLRKIQIDVIICDSDNDLKTIGVAAKIFRFFNKGNTPVVLSRHGLCNLKNKFIHTKIADGIITSSSSIKNSYVETGIPEDKIEVIYSGVSDNQAVPRDFFINYPGREDLCKTKVILSAGRLIDRKRFDILIDAAKILFERRTDAYFILCGAGELETELKEKVVSAKLTDKFRFSGHVENIMPYMAGADIFVLSSRFEGIPDVILEAMSQKKPVVATNIDGIPEVIEDGITGILVRPSRADEIADALEKLLSDDELRLEMGEAGYDKISRRFTLNNMANYLENYLLDKISSNKG